MVRFEAAETLTMTVMVDGSSCTHTAQGGDVMDIPDDHLACIKMARRNPFLTEVP